VENTEVAGHGRSTGCDQVVKPASAKETLSRAMTVAIEMGHTTAGAPANLDLEELLATRLLVQGNSGSGKSHLLRRLLEQSAPWVQQTIIDPEGDFVALADRFGHLLIDAEDHTERGLQVAGERARIHRVSTVLNLEGLDAENQMRRAAAFLGGAGLELADHLQHGADDPAIGDLLVLVFARVGMEVEQKRDREFDGRRDSLAFFRTTANKATGIQRREAT